MFGDIKKLRHYARAAAKMRASRPEKIDLTALWHWYPLWRRSQAPGKTPLDDALPWVNFAAIDFLRQYLRPEMRVFEFGSGGSTLFFAQLAREVVSVEHNPEWCQKVREALQRQNLKNCQLNWIPPSQELLPRPPDPADPEGYTSDDDISRGHSFKAYVTRIDAQPPASLDLILVDGRARPSCLKHAAARAKVGGVIMLDNAERPYYHPAYRLLPDSDWKRREFFGPGPYNGYFWQTNVWQRLR